jgi:hypothetical protein
MVERLRHRGRGPGRHVQPAAGTGGLPPVRSMERSTSAWLVVAGEQTLVVTFSDALPAAGGTALGMLLFGLSSGSNKGIDELREWASIWPQVMEKR